MLIKAAFMLLKKTKSYIEKYYSNLKVTVFFFNKLLNVINSCDGNAEFSASLLQSSVSNYPSEIILMCWFGTQERFHINSVNMKSYFI